MNMTTAQTNALRPGISGGSRLFVKKLKIGIIGDFASGKATFLNALFKAPCFEMNSTHNRVIVEIKASKTSEMIWRYRNNDAEEWKIDLTDIRSSSKYAQITVEIPFFHFNQAIFYDFPQINDLNSWEKDYLSKALQMDYIIYILDAEYALSEKNHNTAHLLCKECKNLVIILNKSDIVDDIVELNKNFRKSCLPPKASTTIFSISALLELQRHLNSEKRMKSFAFTESRENVTTLCDLAFADFRIWLYEIMNNKIINR